MFKTIGSCKEVSRIACKGLDSKLTLAESLALRVHKMVCRICRGYTKEIQQLTALAKEKQIEFSRTLGDVRKQRIKDSLEQQFLEEK